MTTRSPPRTSLVSLPSTISRSAKSKTRSNHSVRDDCVFSLESSDQTIAETFNEFFYRKLKPSARPIESPEDPLRVVSAADCRFMSFESVSEATRLWIKGREFTVKRLLGEKYANEAGRFENGALAIFRLAPQDYHRFHVPVSGRIGEIAEIKGEYYTVNVGFAILLFRLVHERLMLPFLSFLIASSNPDRAGCLWRERS